MRVFASIAGMIALALGVISPTAADAQRFEVFKPKIPIKISTTQRMTSFDPARHGFNFVNAFRNNFVSEFDIRTGGLCGGMVYTALDYWKAGREIPQQSWLPTEGSTLQSYIYQRQVTSITSNLSRWIELGINVDGGRNEASGAGDCRGNPASALTSSSAS